MTQLNRLKKKATMLQTKKHKTQKHVISNTETVKH